MLVTVAVLIVGFFEAGSKAYVRDPNLASERDNSPVFHYGTIASLLGISFGLTLSVLGSRGYAVFLLFVVSVISMLGLLWPVISMHLVPQQTGPSK